MKWIYRFLTLVMLAGALAVPFFINNQQGEPMLSLPKPGDLLPGSASQQVADLPLMPGSQTVYKWQDKDGVWQYGDIPPSGVQNVSTLTVYSNTNLIQGLKVEEPEEEEESESEASSPDKAEKPPEDVLSLERAMNIINEAKQVSGMMEARNEQLRTITGDSK